MAKLANLARMFTSTAGTTSPLVLGTAVTGFKTFAQAGITDGQVVWYAIKDGSNTELGYGTYTASGTSLTRNVVSSTNSDTAISLSGTGSAEVAITPSALSLQRIEAPGGRLTLTTATPVLTSTTSAQTTVYYTPYLHRFVPLYDGTSFEMHDIGAELKNATANTTTDSGGAGTGGGGPAACTTNSNYDLFVWLNGSTYTLTRGPAWSSDTSRGTGAGTTELERVQGILLNKVSITNGPSANRGIYVGTIRTNGSAQVDFILGGTAAGGTAAFLGVWNAYNRVTASPAVYDSTDSWNYATATWRSANNSTGNRIGMVRGLDDEAVFVVYNIARNSSTSNGWCGIGLDSTSASTGTTGSVGPTAILSAPAFYSGNPGIGYHYLQALERTTATAGTCTWYGDAGAPDYVQMSLCGTVRY